MWWPWRQRTTAAERAAEEDRKRRERLEQAAFADGRFVMYIVLNSRQAPVCFTPREAEAATFFRNYLVPWMRNDLRWFSHTTWEGPPQGPAQLRTPFFEVYKGYDVRQVVVLAPTQEYVSRLDTVLANEVRAAEQRTEAEKLAEKSANYSTWVAAMRDAQRGEGER